LEETDRNKHDALLVQDYLHFL